MRDQAYFIAQSLGMSQQILIKMRLNPSGQPLKQFAFYGHSYFMPIIKETDGPLATQTAHFADDPQLAYEVIYQTESGLKSACEMARGQQARCWLNTLRETLSPGHSDDRNILNPDQHWVMSLTSSVLI
ncbi:MAG: hypothetical protein ACI9FJ_002549 [Alteromonadaceae bacterium]